MLYENLPSSLSNQSVCIYADKSNTIVVEYLKSVQVVKRSSLVLLSFLVL